MDNMWACVLMVCFYVCGVYVHMFVAKTHLVWQSSIKKLDICTYVIHSIVQSTKLEYIKSYF